MFKKEDYPRFIKKLTDEELDSLLEGVLSECHKRTVYYILNLRDVDKKRNQDAD